MTLKQIEKAISKAVEVHRRIYVLQVENKQNNEYLNQASDAISKYTELLREKKWETELTT